MSLVSALSKQLSPRTDGALVVSTPQAVSLVDVRKELSFCRAHKLNVLGVVENMAAARVPLSQLRFHDASGVDVTTSALAELAALCPHLLHGTVGLDVFPAAEGGAAAMAAEWGVPLLGSVPLDRHIAAASDVGERCGAPAFEDMVSALLRVTDMPVGAE